MFQNKMVTEATPERVFELCKLVEKCPMLATHLREKMEPAYLQNGSVYFPYYRTAAEELKLITINDNTISLAVDPSIIANMSTMRRYVNSVLSSFEDGHFYLVTHEYYAMSNRALKTDKNLGNLAPLMSRNIGQSVDAVEMRAWRFWVSYLGFGYLHGKFFIPNAKEFLWDAMHNAGMEKNKSYSIGEFVEQVRRFCGIIFDANLSKRELNYGVSNGLRALHDAGHIRLEHIHDQADNWTLYPMKAHTIPDTVTNITICK